MNDQDKDRLARKKDRPMSALDKLVMGTIADDLPLGNQDDSARELFPSLWDWLTRTSAGKTHVMQPARITIGLAPGGVVVSLAHRGLNAGVDAVSDTLLGVFEALEKQLTAANPGIKTFGRGQPKIRKRPQGQ